MSKDRRWLIVAGIAAVAIEIVGTVGWWRWHRVIDELHRDPVVGATQLAEDPILRLPSVVRLMRRLPGVDLARAPAESVVAVLASSSRFQSRWTPVDPRGEVNRARAQLMLGEYELASLSLEAAVRRDPTSPEVHRLAAIAARALGRNEQALDAMATAAGLGAAGWRGRLELTPEEIDWVHLEGLRRHLEFYPRSRTQGLIQLARELRARGDEDGGRAVLSDGVPDPRVMLELARWDIDAGALASATARLEAVIDRRGLPAAILAETWSVTAVARDRGGDREGAVAAAEMALSFDPRSPAPYRVLANLAEERGEMDLALEHLRRAWGMNPTDVGLLKAVARTAEKAGRYDDASLALERAITVAPDDPSHRAALVEFRMRRGDLMEATLDLSAALDRFPTDPKLVRLAERLRAEVARRR